MPCGRIPTGIYRYDIDLISEKKKLQIELVRHLDCLKQMELVKNCLVLCRAVSVLSPAYGSPVVAGVFCSCFGKGGA